MPDEEKTSERPEEVAGGPAQELVQYLEQEAGLDRSVALHIATHFSGPLPHPSILREYDQVHPGLAERIVRMAEEQGIHRRALESKQMDGELGDLQANREAERRGQNFAAALVPVAFAFSIAALWVAPNAAGAAVGTAVGGGTLVAIITALIVGRGKRRSEERDGGENGPRG